MNTSSNGEKAAIVRDVLTELGESLWGRRFFKKNYSVYFSRGRWVLCDAPIGILTGRRSESSIKISVHAIDETGFFIATEKLNGRWPPNPVVTAGVTEHDLRVGLESIREVLREGAGSSGPFRKSSLPGLDSTAAT
ncbi:MAG TPA: hypothetical protein VJ550_16580 [Geomonas sp.]|nr:hypothetical protein [Geomonas sp.]